MSERDLQAKVNAQRAELEGTLDAIEDRLNVPKQFDKLSRKAKSAYDDNPLPWIIGATATAIVVVGVVAWALFTDD